MKYVFLIIPLFIFNSCEPLENKEKEKKESNIIKQYRQDGSLRNEFESLNGKKHGVAKTYYPNGEIQLKMHYVNNIKHGLATTFYKTGNKYVVTPYDSGFIHGIRKYYRPDGKLMAEMPYHKGKATAGLKEYLVNGQEKKNYPKIKINVQDDILLNNRYTLKLSVTNARNKAEYYLGKLDENKCIPDNALRLADTKAGQSELMYSVPPGRFIMEELNIIVLAKTRLGNAYITETRYNLAIENRGY